MPELTPDETRLLTALAELIYCNPFEPKRIELEQAVLGADYSSEPLHAWSRTEATDRQERANIERINQLAFKLVEKLLARQETHGALKGNEARLYDDLVTYVLYYRHVAVISNPLFTPASAGEITKVWRAFRDDRQRLHAPLSGLARNQTTDAEHLFACLHQVRRAFHGIFGFLIGESAPTTRLRAAVWQSIFTHDLRRYRRTLYDRMRDLATLVTGPSGSGKELVAQAIGQSQYRPFDARQEAFVDEDDSFIALNLSALSPTLIESELFGHRKGAFTGADTDRIGWLERCPAHGAVFLDEIGDLDAAIQVKLLRVAQSRDYSRLGESAPRLFKGKLLAATNRDLAAETRAGRFREDLYYRLCSDRVQTPSLAEQLADSPAAINSLVRRLSRRALGETSKKREAENLAKEIELWIAQRMPAGYAWPGNTRELEQCVRSVLVRKEYHPLAPHASEETRWLTQAERGELSADQLLNAYCGHVYRQQRGYEPAAKVLGIDRRTVKNRVLKAKT